MSELAGEQHFPIVFLGGEVGDSAIEVGPAAGVDGAGRRGGFDFDGGLGGDFHLRVVAGDIEVVHGVAHEIAVLHDVGGGADVELKAEQTLQSFAAGLQTDFHDALADGRLVGEGGGVEDRVNHGSLFDAIK